MQLKVENAPVEAGFLVGYAHRLRKRDEVGGCDANSEAEKLPQLRLHLHDGSDAKQVGSISGTDGAAFGGDIQCVVVVGNHFFDVVVRHISAHTDMEILSQRVCVKC